MTFASGAIHIPGQWRYGVPPNDQLCLRFNPLDARGASPVHPPDRPNKIVNSYIMLLYILLS